MHTRILRLTHLAGAALSLIACSSVEPIGTTLDTSTGLTWSSLRTPVAMARRAPEISTAARDYLYMGPVEMNERGARRAYLWLGIATTLDGKPRLLGEAGTPQRMLLEVDEFAFELPVSAWQGETPYDTAAPVAQALRARISLDQIVHVAQAERVRATLVMADGSTAAFDYWGGSWQSWLRFRAAVDPLAANR